MKFKIFLTITISVLSFTTKIYGSVPKSEPDFNKVVNKFINAVLTSDYNQLNELLREDLRFKVPHANHVMTFAKASIIDDVKLKSGMQLAFKTSYVVLSENSAAALVRIDFAYENTVMEN